MTGPASRVASAVWLAVLAVMLGLQIRFPRIETDPVNDTYSVEVGGRNVLYQFASRKLPYVARNHDSLVLATPYFDYDDTVCLLGPARYPSEREWMALLEWVSRGGNLLFAARWEDPEVSIPTVNARVTTGDSPSTTPAEAEKAGGTPAGKTQKEKDDRNAALKLFSNTKVSGVVETDLVSGGPIEWKSNASVDAPGSVVLLTVGESPQVVRVRYGGGSIMLLASDYVFSNTSLADRSTQNATLAVRLLETAGTEETVWFDESLTATGTPRVVGILLDPLLRPLSIQACLLALLFTWRGNRRFGAVLPPSRPARHDITDHANALGNLYYKVRDSNGVLRSYLDQLRHFLKLRPTRKGSRERIVLLARQTGRPEAALEALLARATAAADDTSISRRDAAHIIRELAELRRAAAREHVD
jgi:hypothetical protein